MRIQKIANKIEELGGTRRIEATHRADDSRYIVKLTGKLGRYEIEAVDYGSRSPLSTDADVSVVAYKREDDAPDSETGLTAWLFVRTIRELDQLAPKRTAVAV